jgi:hypothetical protein
MGCRLKMEVVMSLWIGQVAYDTRKPKMRPSSYRFTVFELDDCDYDPTNRLSQVGAVENNIVRYVGSFASEADAAKAILKYIAAP